MDLIRIRYDDYKYFIVVLESIISQRRIDADIAGKLIIIVNKFLYRNLIGIVTKKIGLINNKKK